VDRRRGPGHPGQPGKVISVAAKVLTTASSEVIVMIPVGERYALLQHEIAPGVTVIGRAVRVG
jgi:hypothetical protein